MAEIQELRHKEEEEKPLWTEILPELLCLIASSAFESDFSAITNIRSVCKSWRSMLTQIPRSPPPLSLHNMPKQYPCLMSLKGQVCEFFHPNFRPSFQVDIPELAKSYIRFSKFGWLLLSRRNNATIFFFNPLTRQKIELPNCTRKFITMCFSSPPTAPYCTVFGWTFGLKSIAIIQRGELEWKFYETLGYYRYVNSYPVFARDRFYCLKSDGNVVAFDLKKKKFYVLKNPHGYRLNNDYYFLVESSGELFAISLPSEEDDIVMFRFNLTKKLWVEIQALRNKMLFISPTASFLLPTDLKTMSNKIFFPRIKDDDYIVYSIARRRHHTSFSNYSSEIPLDVKNLTNCTWFELVSGPQSFDEQEIQW